MAGGTGKKPSKYKTEPEAYRALSQAEKQMVQPVPPSAFAGDVKRLTGTASATKQWLSDTIKATEKGKEVVVGQRNELVAKGIDVAISRFSAGDFSPDVLLVIRNLMPYLLGAVEQKVKIDVRQRSEMVLGMINMAEEERRKFVQNTLLPPREGER